MEVQTIRKTAGFITALLLLADIVLVTALWRSGAFVVAQAVLLFLVWYLLAAWVSGLFMLKRLNHIVFRLMDPIRLQREMDQYFQKESRKKTSLYYMYESTRHDLLGEFEEALACSLKKEFKHPRMALAVKAGLAYLYARVSNLEKAAEYLPCCEGLSKSPNAAVRASCLHTLGFYHLQKGDDPQARQYFEDALRQDNTVLTQLNVHFDLACLEDKEGNPDKATEHYRQAAALGAKTWMGQEAVRRLYARGIKLDSGIYAGFLMRQAGNQ